MAQVLRHELHTHLAGCLTAEDLWTWGKDRYRKYPERLVWYADEYEKATGRRPNPTAYWETDGGFEQLKFDFIFKTPAPFPVFQAHINLMIALCPAGDDEDAEILRTVLLRDAENGLIYSEYRVFVPPSTTDFNAYFSKHAKVALDCEAETGGVFLPRIALSLSRDEQVFNHQYQALRTWQTTSKDLAQAVVAIDFCGNEEIDPPRGKQKTFARIRRDNKANPDFALAILHHVGESFQGHSLGSAARWVWQAHDFGAHRLGHALGAAVHPDVCIDRAYVETATERADHLRWLLDEEKRLNDYGYSFDKKEVRSELESLSKASPYCQGVYDEQTLAETYRLQEAVLEFLADQNAIVEVCPTSNFRIGQIEQADHHSLPRFLETGVQVVICSNNPGIFGITLDNKAELCREIFGLQHADLEKIDQLAAESKAALLSRKKS